MLQVGKRRYARKGPLRDQTGLRDDSTRLQSNAKRSMGKDIVAYIGVPLVV